MSNKEDPVWNIKFIEIVERFPCIYDYNSEEYSRRETTEKAWSTISTEMNETGKIHF